MTCSSRLSVAPTHAALGWLQSPTVGEASTTLTGPLITAPRFLPRLVVAPGRDDRLVGQAATVACISHTRTSAASVAVTFCPPVAVNRTASPLARGPAPSR